jgi:hypothetical protein
MSYKIYFFIINLFRDIVNANTIAMNLIKYELN